MGVNKPDWAFLFQENGFKIDMEDGNGLQDSTGNGSLLLEQQSIGCEVSPILASIPLFLAAGLAGTMAILSEIS